jgi:hypothetical protein
VPTVDGTAVTTVVGTMSLVEGATVAGGAVVWGAVVDVDGEVDVDEHAAMASAPASAPATARQAHDKSERLDTWMPLRRRVGGMRVMVMGVLRGLAVDDSRRGGRHHSRPIGPGCRPATG